MGIKEDLGINMRQSQTVKWIY